MRGPLSAAELLRAQSLKIRIAQARTVIEGRGFFVFSHIAQQEHGDGYLFHSLERGYQLPQLMQDAAATVAQRLLDGWEADLKQLSLSK
jgi:hypothetical protein